MNRKWTTVLAVLACLALAGIALAQVSSNYDNHWHVLGAGGSQGLSSANYTLHGTLGQTAIGPASGNLSAAGLGYWYGVSQLIGGGTVAMGPSVMKATTPYAMHTFQVTITNTGNSQDTLNLSHAADLGWVVKKPANVTLGAGASTQVNVVVEIPFTAPNWITETVILTATSQNNGSQAGIWLITWTGGYWSDMFASYVGCRFDLNYNGAIDFAGDVQAVAGRYGSTTQPAYDFNHNGQVDFAGDVQTVAGRYGQTCPSPP